MDSRRHSPDRRRDQGSWPLAVPTPCGTREAQGIGEPRPTKRPEPGREASARYAVACASAGALLLALGAVPYFLCRSTSPVVLAMVGYGPAPELRLCQAMPMQWYVPSFAHAGGFALVSCAALPARRRWIATACGFWLIANILWEGTRRRAGVIDVADLVAAALGVGAATALGILSQRLYPPCPEEP